MRSAREVSLAPRDCARGFACPCLCYFGLRDLTLCKNLERNKKLGEMGIKGSIYTQKLTTEMKNEPIEGEM
jgi:hypothetical protein